MKNPLDLNVVIVSTQEIIAQLLSMEVEDIAVSHCLVEDLSADSLDIIDLSFQLGRLYGCTLPKVSVLDHTVEVCGNTQDFVDRNGLTEMGKRLLEGSLNHYTSEQLRVGMSPSEIFSKTTVHNWASQCYNLFNYLPAQCPQCSSKISALNARAQVVCGSCSARLTPADGDDVSRLLVEDFVASNVEHLA